MKYLKESKGHEMTSRQEKVLTVRGHPGEIMFHQFPRRPLGGGAHKILYCINLILPQTLFTFLSKIKSKENLYKTTKTRGRTIKSCINNRGDSFRLQNENRYHPKEIISKCSLWAFLDPISFGYKNVKPRVSFHTCSRNYLGCRST